MTVEKYIDFVIDNCLKQSTQILFINFKVLTDCNVFFHSVHLSSHSLLMLNHRLKQTRRCQFLKLMSIILILVYNKAHIQCKL